MASTHNLLEFRDTMPAEERSRLEARILQSHEAEAQVAKVPLLQSEAIKNRGWVKKKTHGKANARGLTGAEIAGRELKAQERRAAKGVNTPCIAAQLQEEGAPGKRKRIVTQRYTEARHAGLLP